MKTGKKSILITILPILSMCAAIIPGYLNKNSFLEVAKIAILTMVLTAVATFYILANENTILGKRLSRTIITLGYLSAICLLLFIPKPYMFCFWMIGGLLIAMLIDNKLGMLFHFNLTIIMAISLSMGLELVIQIMVIGAMMCLLSGALRTKATAVYAAIIILSTNVTLSFVINNFIFNKEVKFNYLNSLFSILAVLVTAFLLCLFYDGTGKKINTEEAKAPDDIVLIDTITTDHATEQVIHSSNQSTEESKEEKVAADDKPSYDILCSEENELLRKLKETSESIYAHALRIGDLSYRAAKVVGADELLAKAGGLYHEIGKLRGKNYIEEGLAIAEEYSFPKELRAILKEHNIKYDKPSSVEAVIVMLSDNIVSTIDYIAKSEDNKYPIGKIIDNIFQLRMDKGTFDGVNLSLKDFKELKAFYEREFIK
jgi:putative nucleotidyltransferase with HDIG domain